MKQTLKALSSASALLYAHIHRSAWKVDSPKSVSDMMNKVGA
jgi:hypothetical protein